MLTVDAISEVLKKAARCVGRLLEPDEQLMRKIQEERLRQNFDRRRRSRYTYSRSCSEEVE